MRDNEFENTNIDESTGDTSRTEEASSLYSFNYRDKTQHTATHQGDYDARRDDMAAGVNYSTSDDATYASGANNSYQSNANQNAQWQSGSQNTQWQGGSQNTQWQGGNQNTQWQGGNQSRSYYNPQDGSVYRSQTTAREKKPSKNPFKKGGFLRGLVKCVVFAVVFGLVAGGVFQGVTHIGGDNTSESQNQAGTIINNGGTLDPTAVSTAVTVTDVSDIVDNVMPAIVSITSMSQVEVYNWFGQPQSYEGESAGSGIIVAEDDVSLYIVTNNHVVQSATSLTISFVDDASVTAVVKGTDPSSDLAVVSVTKSDMTAETLSHIKIATLGDSDQLRVGESAIAIGNALGYGQSVTTGVISALNREVTMTDSTTGTSITNELVQTDAAINPGNSGGALLNMNGEVIGINSVKYSDTQVEGMGYAIPINTADPIINELITREKVSEAKSAYLGISGMDVTSELSQTYNMPEGVYIAQVSSGSAAEKAGLVVGDIITQFDGKQITSMETLKDLLQYYEAGTTVDIVIQYADRGGYVEETISVTLGSKNN